LPAPLEKIQPESNPGADLTADNSAAAENENYVANRIAELEDLAMTDDSSSLATIESELDSREPRIQEAAVAATIQFGSRDAIPALRAAYGHLDDPGQKVNIQMAIDFLELPTLSETANATALTNNVASEN
jgi:HEAT repeat protein